MAHQPPDQPQRIAIYARISADLDEHAVGVAGQAKDCRALIARRFPAAEIFGPACQCRDCEKIGTPADVYCDNDMSASGKVRRPHYERLVSDIRAGRVDAVVTVHTDRLHRNLSDLETYMKACEPRDVPTYTVKAGELDLTTSSGRVQARIMGTVARYELERMMERQQSAKRRNRDAGIRSSGRAPFGYRLDDRDPVTGRQIPGVSKGLVIVPEEATVIRKAYTDLLAGVSLASIARQWNQAGLRTHQAGAEWKSKEIRRVLMRGATAGMIEHPAGSEGRGQIVGKAAWEPIIDEETWLGARALLANPSRKTSPGPKPHWLLTGVLICGVCGGRTFWGKNITRKTGEVTRYICASTMARPGASTSGWHLARDMASIDEFVVQVIIGRLRQPDVMAAIAAKPHIDLNEIIVRRNGLRARLDELGQLFAAGDIDGMQLAAGSKPLRAAIEQADQDLADAYSAPALDDFTSGKDPAVIWAALDIDRKRAVAATLLRVRLLPVGNGGGFLRVGYPARGKKPLDPATIEILPSDA